MKFLTVSLLFLPMFASALNYGNDGGGGHFCKSQAQLYFQNIVDTLQENPDLQKKYPEWSALSGVMDPKKNPGFTIAIKESPIKGCKNTEGALACSYPQQNLLQVYCGESGWNSLSLKEKYKLIMHEIYWWSDLDDSNYHFSAKLSEDLYQILSSGEGNRRRFKTFQEGEISSAETVLNKISDCMPVNVFGNTAVWEKVNGTLVCKENKKDLQDYNRCVVNFKMNYSFVINRIFVADIDYRPLHGEIIVPIGTVFSEKTCKDFVKAETFSAKSHDLLSDADLVQSGNISYPGGIGDPTVCHKSSLRITYDPHHNSVSTFKFSGIPLRCP